MFPGTSTLNQIERCLQVTGRPTDAELDAISPHAKATLVGVPVSKPTSLKELYPEADPDALDLVRSSPATCIDGWLAGSLRAHLESWPRLMLAAVARAFFALSDGQDAHVLAREAVLGRRADQAPLRGQVPRSGERAHPLGGHPDPDRRQRQVLDRGVSRQAVRRRSGAPARGARRATTEGAGTEGGGEDALVIEGGGEGGRGGGRSSRGREGSADPGPGTGTGTSGGGGEEEEEVMESTIG
jgi:hypothetical protein